MLKLRFINTNMVIFKEFDKLSLHGCKHNLAYQVYKSTANDKIINVKFTFESINSFPVSFVLVFFLLAYTAANKHLQFHQLSITE